MVVTALDERTTKGGEKLLRQLDAAGVTTDAALWMYFPESQSWKLLLSLDIVVERGPKAAYEAIQKVIGRSGGEPAISLEDVSVVRPDDRLLRLLRIAVPKGAGISGIRFTNNVINGELIQDAYIYRLTHNKTMSSKAGKET